MCKSRPQFLPNIATLLGLRFYVLCFFYTAFDRWAMHMQLRINITFLSIRKKKK